MITGLSVAALGLALLLVLWVWIRPPAYVPIKPPPNAPEIALPPGVSPVPGGPGSEDRARGGIYTFLLAGIHEGNTDTLMVATLDTERGTCHVLSIPRDTLIARAPRNVKKINSAYSQQNNTWDNEPGMKQLKKEIATLIGYQPQYSAVVDYNAIRRLVDAVEGVDFDVPVRMNIPAEGINLPKGPQRLSGSQAMQLLRYRGYGPNALGPGLNDDYGRMHIQQQFLAAAGKKALSNWTKVPSYIDIAQENVKSDDIDWGNMIWFAQQLRRIGMENVSFHTLPTYTIEENFYEVVKSEEALKLINETINPFTSPIGPEFVEHTVR
jgi:LCP family protein required for cell wall assembly